ncbi:hypothetical protein B0J18DRAFT_191995 [Chaetomium sp. MPI-SDFR-AT-0129]|nr:hypothetical protein B0J18DRAFT_191995 [Chaetomium sp. MPI-SDFR-AT-0129]
MEMDFPSSPPTEPGTGPPLSSPTTELDPGRPRSSSPTEPGTGPPRSSSPTEPGTGPPPEAEHTDSDSVTETGSNYTVTGTTTRPTALPKLYLWKTTYPYTVTPIDTSPVKTNPVQNNLPANKPTNNPKAVPLSTILEIKEELISQVLTLWTSHQYPIPDPAIAAEMAAMSWDYDSLPASGPGCLMKLTRTQEGEYVYMPYDDNMDGMEEAMVARVEKTAEWMRDPENGAAIRRLDGVLEREVDENCFWELLEQGGGAERVDRIGKVKMLARQRLTQKGGIDVFAYNPRMPFFRVGAIDVTYLGQVKMRWFKFPWDSAEQPIINAVNGFCGTAQNPSFDPAQALASLITQLEAIHHPQPTAQAAEEMIALVQAQGPIQEPAKDGWVYMFSDWDKLGQPLERMGWTHTEKSLNDIKRLRRLSREKSQWPIFVRPSLLQHYNRCMKLAKLQWSQMQYCHMLEQQALQRGGYYSKEEEPYFQQG